MKLNNYLLSVLALTLSACGTTGLNQAPVVERSLGTPAKPAAQVPAPTGVTPGIMSPVVSAPTTRPANAGASYTVKRGDTLYQIALENGVSYRDIAAWNGIANPNYIQADQALRLSPPAADSNNPVAVSAPVVSGTPSPATPPVAPISTPTPAANAGDVVWSWPVKGKVTESFTEGKSKGISIAGNTGDAIFAAADGKVVYAGSALKGYGPMLIIKHNEVFITAYAHNSKLLVKEEQTVKRGQHIADMGNAESEGGKTKLHFELRRNGKPLDPSKVLPAN